MKRKFGVVAIGVLFLTACAGAYSPQDRLQLQVDQFNDYLRWGRYFSAARFVHEDSRQEWLESHRGWTEDLRIADYEVVDSTPDEEEEETAVVRVVVSWYRMSQSEIQTTMFAQHWRREGQAWLLISEDIEEGTPL